MPNIQSNKKSLRKIEKRTIQNRSILSRMKTQSKKILKKVEANNLDGIDKEVSAFYQYVDKTVKKGIIKENKGARKKSEITKKIYKAQKKTIKS